MSWDKVNSAAWYDRNAGAYIARTDRVDLSGLYEKFLEGVPPGGRILDAGCGSGRDSLAFQNVGYVVMPMDASVAMVEHASRLLNTRALLKRHQDIDFVEQFDGVWSNASLLHVPHAELTAVLAKYRTALRRGGVLFASFKHGEGEQFRDDRLFSNQNAGSFRQLIDEVPGLILIDSWLNADRRPGRHHEQWFSVLCRRDHGDDDS